MGDKKAKALCGGAELNRAENKNCTLKDYHRTRVGSDVRENLTRHHATDHLILDWARKRVVEAMSSGDQDKASKVPETRLRSGQDNKRLQHEASELQL